MYIEPSFSAEENPQLTKAILLYQNGESLSSPDHHQGICLATLHTVVFDRELQRSVVTEGHPLTAEAFNGLWAQMRQAPTKRELLPASLLYTDDTCLLWWMPSHRRTIYFSTADKEFNAAVHSKEVLHPALLFKANPNGLHVFALPLNQRPEASTVVSVAPYCNLYDGGDMCRGDIKLPGRFDASQIGAWERVFYDSRFTHTNLNAKKLTLHPGGHHALWREMVTTQEEVFPIKYLTPTKLTVRNILSGGGK